MTIKELYEKAVEGGYENLPLKVWSSPHFFDGRRAAPDLSKCCGL